MNIPSIQEILTAILIALLFLKFMIGVSRGLSNWRAPTEDGYHKIYEDSINWMNGSRRRK